ncbi:MAG: hypothetical protein K6L73_05175 [Cellvibrionaceae bacterium]
MIKKACPWCENKVSTWQFGSRPRKTKPKWHQFTRHLKVCPYCARGVKFGGKSLYALSLTAPLFLVLPIQLIAGKENFNSADYQYFFFFLAMTGIFVSFFGCEYLKDEE